jgi:NADPH:quinone reductase-like Zn-dependent oxidoreductase
MKSIVFNEYGGPDVMSIQDMPEPETHNRDIKIKIHSAGINPVDWKTRAGFLKRVLKLQFPAKMGFDCAGEVVEVGMRARNTKVGDRVYAYTGAENMGTFSEYMTVEKTDVAPMPESLSYEDAASLPLVGLTAWQVLMDVMKLKKGQKIFIHSGSGGVGTITIQLAKHLGAEITTTSSEKNHAFLKALGADQCIDYTKEDFTTLGPEFDAVFAVTGDKDLLNSFKIVKPGGIVVGITALPDEDYAKQLGLGFFARLILRKQNKPVIDAAQNAEANYRFWAVQPSEAQLRRIAELVDKGIIKPTIDSVFDFEQYKEAFSHLEQGHVRGKVVLRVIPSNSGE